MINNNSLFMNVLRSKATEARILEFKGKTTDSSKLDTVELLIKASEEYADAGTQVTPMDQMPPGLRKIARGVGTLIIYLLSFITAKQRSFNYSIIACLRNMNRHFQWTIESLESRMDKNMQVKYKEIDKKIYEMSIELDNIKSVINKEQALIK